MEEIPREEGVRGKPSRAKKFYETIGKAVVFSGTVIGLIWGMMQIVDHININNVVATLIKHEFILPPEVKEVVQPSTLKDVTGVWEFSIKNVGKETVVDLKLDKLPKGLYQTSVNNQRQRPISFDGTIFLPALNPNDELKVLIWVMESQSHANYGQHPILNHSKGYVEIEEIEPLDRKARKVFIGLLIAAGIIAFIGWVRKPLFGGPWRI